MTFCEVDAPAEVIADRINQRKGHYMPPSLLPSQLATLEPLADDEPGVHVSAADTPDQIVRHALAKLGLTEEADTRMTTVRPTLLRALSHRCWCRPTRSRRRARTSS